MKVVTASGRDTSELLALAVHELRTPVTVVAGYLRMLARHQLGELSERQQKVVEEAERSCARLTALLREMGELADLDNGRDAAPGDDVPLGPLVNGIAGSIEDGRDRGVLVACTGTEAAFTVRADRTRLTSSLRALVTAVVREQSDPTRVMLELAGKDGNGEVLLAIGPEGTTADVMHTGGPDARLNEYRGGLGLALPIARRVIERAGGRVWSSATGKRLGAIAVRLPLKETTS